MPLRRKSWPIVMKFLQKIVLLVNLIKKIPYTNSDDKIEKKIVAVFCVGNSRGASRDTSNYGPK